MLDHLLPKAFQKGFSTLLSKTSKDSRAHKAATLAGQYILYPLKVSSLLS